MILDRKALEERLRKARKIIVEEVSGELTAQARSDRLRTFTADASRLVRLSGRKSVLLIAMEQ